MLTEARVRELAARRGAPVITSLYLDVDGRRYPRVSDYEPHVDHLLRSARERAAGLDDEARQSVEADLVRIEARLREGFDRSRTRGVALFAGRDLFEVVEVPRPVRNQIVLNQAPAVRQLEFLLEEYPRVIVVLVDRQRARLFRFELGELVERHELFDPVPPRADGVDDGGLLASHVQRHSDELARRHLRHAAEALFGELEDWVADQVFLGGPREAVAEFEELLHPYVAEKVAARLSVSVQAGVEDVRAATLEAEQEAERRREAALLVRLRDAVGAGAGGVAGLGETLRAVYERRVDTLVVSQGYEAPGWRCSACGLLAVEGSTCGVCSAVMEKVEDVVGEAVDAALTGGAKVQSCVNPDLDVLGRVGAFLRY